MMKKLCFLLAVIITFGIGNDNYASAKLVLTGQSVKPITFYLNIDTSVRHKSRIPIIAWIGVPEGQISLVRYQEMKAVGITESYYPFSNANAMEKALDLAQKAGLKLFVACPELTASPETTVKRFMKHPALAGYFIKDEPSSRDFARLGLLIKRIRTIDEKHICYVNLLPNYASTDQLGVDSYKEYLDAFVKQVPSRLLSFDYYPIVGNTSDAIQSQWYDNLEKISAEAIKSNEQFWGFALTVAFTPHPIPTMAGLRLQVYSNLAYGAQGIQYFTYWTVDAPGISFSNAPITRDGHETAIYVKIQNMNKEIKNLSVVFAGAKLISVAHTGKVIPQGTQPLTRLPKPIELLKTYGLGAIVSVMRKGNESFLVVVNRDFTASMALEIKCAKGVDRVLKDGTFTPEEQSIGTIKIGPGDIEIYRWPDALN